MRILVTHPGRQHSHQAALALSRVGRLAGYWSGVPATAGQFERVPSLLRAALRRYSPVDLPEDRARWHPWTPARRRLGDRLLPRGMALWNDFAACRSFDRWAAGGIGHLRPDAVIACEISAAATFEAAKRLGATTILDAASLHHAAQDRLHGTSDSPTLHRKIVAVKEEEIALADHILTCSELARETYVAAGVSPAKVHAVQLGADLEIFRPAPEATSRGAECRVVFAGATIRRKGFDLALAAFRAALAAAPNLRLRIAGPRGELAHLLTGAPPEIEFLGPLPQGELARGLESADLLLLPSRNESYGMVVAEALACGLPVLISEMVGAKDLVEEGRSGWIVPVEDVAAIAERLRWCAGHLGELRALRPECRKAAAAATWESYHRRLTDLLQRLLERRAA